MVMVVLVPAEAPAQDIACGQHWQPAGPVGLLLLEILMLAVHALSCPYFDPDDLHVAVPAAIRSDSAQPSAASRETPGVVFGNGCGFA